MCCWLRAAGEGIQKPLADPNVCVCVWVHSVVHVYYDTHYHLQRRKFVPNAHRPLVRVSEWWFAHLALVLFPRCANTGIKSFRKALIDESVPEEGH